VCAAIPQTKPYPKPQIHPNTLSRSAGVTVPIVVVHSVLLVPLRVNGKAETFILDTGGGSGFLLDSRVADQLQLRAVGEQRTSGAGDDNVTLKIVTGLEIELAGKRFSDVTAGVTDFAAISRYLNTEVDGLLGVNIFSPWVVVIDYCEQKVQFIDPSQFQAPRAADVLPITKLAAHYATSGAVQFAPTIRLAGMFLLDTGAGPIAVGITQQQAERLHINTESAQQDVIPALGGSFRARLILAQSVRVGNSTLRNLTIHASENASGGMASGEYVGVIGGEFFRRFLTIFDVPHRRLILGRAARCH